MASEDGVVREEAHLRAKLEHTEAERDALRTALREQWEYNHAENCGTEWPHPEGYECGWPLLALLRGVP